MVSLCVSHFCLVKQLAPFLPQISMGTNRWQRRECERRVMHAYSIVMRTTPRRLSQCARKVRFGVALVGPAGAGKSTIRRLLSTASIWLRNEELAQVRKSCDMFRTLCAMDDERQAPLICDGASCNTIGVASAWILHVLAVQLVSCGIDSHCLTIFLAHTTDRQRQQRISGSGSTNNSHYY